MDVRWAVRFRIGLVQSALWTLHFGLGLVHSGGAFLHSAPFRKQKALHHRHFFPTRQRGARLKILNRVNRVVPVYSPLFPPVFTPSSTHLHTRTSAHPHSPSPTFVRRTKNQEPSTKHQGSYQRNDPRETWLSIYLHLHQHPHPHLYLHLKLNLNKENRTCQSRVIAQPLTRWLRQEQGQEQEQV